MGWVGVWWCKWLGDGGGWGWSKSANIRNLSTKLYT